MPSVTKSVELPLSPQDAFALATDTTRFAEWLTLHAAWPQGAPGTPEEGASFTQSLRIMGMPADVQWTIEALEASSRIVMRGAGPMGAMLATTITATATGDGATVSYEAEFSGAAIHGPMGDMVTKTAGQEIETSLDRLRALVA